MAYVPPHLRGKKHRSSPQRSNPLTNYQLVEDDFPALGSTPAKKVTVMTETKWTKGSFKEVVSNTDIVFDFEILKQRKEESPSEYYNRLNTIYTRTSTLHKYSVFTLKHKKRKQLYRVAARHEIMARFICQKNEFQQNTRLKNSQYASFKQSTFDQMCNDDELWDYVLSFVGGDNSKRDEAIKLYYRESCESSPKVTSNWLNPDEASCIETSEKCISKEKIIY